jgi:hypothetical protein
MINKCKVCQKEFEAKRKTAKYCSEACKQRNKRVVSVSNTIVSDNSVSDDLVTIEKEIIADETKLKEKT